MDAEELTNLAFHHYEMSRLSRLRGRTILPMMHFLQYQACAAALTGNIVVWADPFVALKGR